MTGEKPHFAWVLNLDAELELAQKGYTPRARLLAQLEQYGADSRLLLGPNDVLVRELPNRSRPSDFVGRAWCPTPRALALFASSGVKPEPHPDVAVLLRVNHRRFAFELGGGLPAQRYLVDKSELDAELRKADGPLLLKRPLAFAGRGQLRVYAYQRISEKEWSWIDVSLRNDGLIVEPLVVPTLEFSLHGFVWRNAQHELGQPCIQEVTNRGVFRGVRRALPGDLDAREERALFEQGERVAAALASAGYFGPFGIDAYRYDHDGRVLLCALSEINARYTMGFLTGFPRHPSELWLG
jgi:hypothetical protein